MPTLHQTTKTTSAHSVQRNWHLIDVRGKVLGRVTGEIARLLMGKHKVTYSPNIDEGDYVVVINAKLVKVTGKKRTDKIYSYYSGYPGGLRQVPFQALQDRRPEEIIRHAVMGKLPKNKLRNKRIVRLYIYPGSEHPHTKELS